MKYLVKTLLLSFVLFSSTSHASWKEASDIMDRTTAGMLALVTDETLTQPDNIELLMQRIDQLMGGTVDFNYIAKSVMGKYYRRASDAQVNQFASVLKTTLLRTYAKAVVGFEFKTYELVPPIEASPDPDKQIVSVNVFAADGTVYSLNYYMVQKNGQWSLVNVVVDGINLRITFRNQFAGMMERHSKVGVAIDQWAEAMADVVKDSQ